MTARREFITLLGGAAAAWPLAARAQQPTVPIVGYLSAAASDSPSANLADFRRGLAEAGYVEGQNMAIEYRWAGDQFDRLPALATELLSRKVAVLYVVSNAAAYAAKAATSTVPIVFLSGGDPVEIGLIAELLRETVPNVALIAFMINPTNPRAKVNTSELQAAARAARQDILIVNVSYESEFDAAFETLTQRGAGALLVDGDILFNAQRDWLIRLAERHHLPASYQVRESTVAGGLMSYGPSLPDAHRQGGVYVGRILKGEKPADLPVVRPTKFELVINLKTAKALGLSVPPSLLALADEVIE